MKLNKLFFLISMLFLSQVILIINTPQNSIAETNFSGVALKTSKPSGVIHINNNWTAAKAAGICTGSGTYSDPYIIEDLEIDGGGSGNCILIENSNVYFRIERCTLYNSGLYSYAGIYLSYVNNSHLRDNDCSNNNQGLMLENCNNNTISGNIANNNNNYGIYLHGNCNNNAISENSVDNNGFGIYLYLSSNNILAGNNINNNRVFGIYVLRSKGNKITENIISDTKYGISINDFSYNNNLSRNLMSNCYFQIYGNSQTHDSQYIDTTNLVNEKSVYYYTYEINLKSANFTNAGQIILIRCSNSSLANLNVSNIYFYYCDNITIHHNEIVNSVNGIYFWNCNNIIISENNIKENERGIYFRGGHSNSIKKNKINESIYRGIYLSNSDNNDINGNTVNNGLELFSSQDNDILENSFNNSSYGIKLDKSDSNTIMGNIVCNNSYYGIYLIESNNNDLTGNNANYNGKQGIYLYNSDLNTISNNTANENDIGIELYYSNQTDIFENNIQNCEYAIHINESLNNSITDNCLHGCGICLNGTFEQLISHDLNTSNTVNGKYIYFYINESNLNPSNFSDGGQIILIGCNDSILSNLNLTANSLGISLYYSHNNTFYENSIKNEIYGLYLHYSSDNLFYNNTFIQNSRHAVTIQSSENYFNNNIIGNYWDDYNGFDCNGDGIGETPYILGDVIDYFPICDRFDIYAPNITILEPLTLQEYQGEVPLFSIVIEEYLLDSFWYTIDEGLNNATITSYMGHIDQQLWNEIPFGEITIVFYAKDVAGNIGSAMVIVVKKSIETSAPFVPGYNLFITLGLIGLIAFLIISKRYLERCR